MKGSLVILTGAGISAESGLRTFRDANGLWENHRVEDVASPEGFARNPGLVQRFYNERRAQLLACQPNDAHRALAELERRWEGEFLLITQNVDDLHGRAGSRKLHHMHGELLKARCQRTEEVVEWREPILPDTRCACCGKAGTLRPHIVWFGETPLLEDDHFSLLSTCDIFVSIGTSGNVYPAAGFVDLVPRGARRIEVNREESMISERFQDHRVGLAGEKVPELVAELLRQKV
jgi:NAD-dependent deacetylase